MPKDVIITPASGKLDFYGTTGGSVLANINLTDNNDLSLSTTSGNLIIGDASRDVYIGDGTNEVDIVFEQNGEIRSVAGKYITVNAGTVNATGVAVNTSSPTAVMHVYGATPSGTVLNVEGTNGSLFSVVDNLDGTLMSVNNNAGLPVLEVFSDDKIVGGRFGQNDFVVSSSGNVGIGVANPSTKLEVSGTIKATNFSGVGTSLTAGYAQNIVGEDGGGYSASVLPPGGAIPYISEIGTTVFRTIGSANQVLKSNGDNPVWGSVQYSEIGGTAPTWNQNTTGTSAGVIRTVTGTNSAELVRCNMADNDNFRILAGATATNAGYVEIATSDDGTEPIYIRQYTGAFATLTRTATILDGAGNTSFPGSVTANSLVKSGGTSSQFLKADGSVDSSTYLTSLSHNHGIANSAGTQQFTFGINDNVRIAGGGATSIAFDSATKQVTISSTDTNTTYTANNGIVLNGTTFSHVDTSSQGSVDNSNGTVIQDVTLDTYGHVTALGSVNLDGRYYTESEVDTLLSSKLDTSLKGTNNGLAELDSTGKVPSSQLPSYVDDVLEYADLASFPTSGEESKIYIAWDTNKTYRWSGTGYIEISASLALGESGSTAYRGDRGKTAYDHSQVTTGAIHGSSTVGTALFRISNNSTSIKFIRVNADNTLTYRTGSEVLSDIGAYAATNPNGYTTNTGTVTSVAGTGSVAGLTLTGTVTTTGNLTLGGILSTPVSTINDSTTVGQNLVKLTDPSAITFLRINANNSVSALNATDFRTAIGAQATLTNPVTGTGTLNYISKWSSSSAQTNSIIFDNGTNVGIGTTTPNAKVHVYGTVASGVLLNVEGTNGSLFSVIDDLTGSLMSVNTVAGLPVLEVFDDYKVVAGRYNQNDFVVSSSGNVGLGVANPSTKLEVSGTIKATVFNGAGTNLTGTASSLTVGSLYDANQAISVGVGTSQYDIAQRTNYISVVSLYGVDWAENSLYSETSATATYADQLNYPRNLWGQSFNGTANVSGNISGAGNITMGTQANKATLTYTTNTARTYTIPDAGANADFVLSAGNQNVGGVKTFTSQIINTTANSTANGGGQIYLNGATGNRIDFNTNGVGVPNLYSRTLGSKINLYPSLLTGSATDFAIGLGNDGAGAPTRFWQSVDTTNSRFEWFAGATSIATLTGSGVLTIQGGTSQINVDNLKLDGNIVGVNSNNTNIQILASGINSNVYLGPIPPTSSSPGENGFGVTADSLYVYDSFGFGESNDTVGEGIKFTYAGGISTLRVNNGGGNAGSVFKATADSGIDTQGRLTLNTLATNTKATKINEILQLTTSNNTANTIMPRSYPTSKLILPAQSTWCFIINLSAYNSTDNVGAAWIFKGAIRRNNSAGTALIGSVLEENWKETGMTAASANVVANDTDDSLDIRVTGLSSKTIHWTASIDLTQANN